jgi:hypothetical protein
MYCTRFLERKGIISLTRIGLYNSSEHYASSCLLFYTHCFGDWFLSPSSDVTNCFRPLQHCERGFESHIGMDVCVCSVCVFSVSTVSSETASRPNKRLVRTYHWISLFNVIYKVAHAGYGMNCLRPLQR